MARLFWLLGWMLASILAAPLHAAPSNARPPTWYSQPPAAPTVTLYFFWSYRCPHCLQARPFIESLPRDHPWIEVRSLEVLGNIANRRRFAQIASDVGFKPRSVPTFVWCGKHLSGYAGEKTTGRFLLGALQRCYQEHYGATPGGMPLLSQQSGTTTGWPAGLDPTRQSLLTLTLVLGGMDAFNPCAFFVLLFLLSLLVNTRSRGRMLLVGGLFVLVSGLLYFAFMAAWLNLFQLLGALSIITLAAGVIAVVLGVIGIKDYFRLHPDITLSVSDSHRSRLYARIRDLLVTGRLPALLAGTLVLAVAANTYELLCTLGLPMLYTRVLTLHQLPTQQYYAYLALYNLVYVTPLAIVVGLFVATMGRRKLSESEGRFLKLLSGILMVSLGLVLILAPGYLSSAWSTLLLIALALILSVVVHWLWRRKESGEA